MIVRYSLFLVSAFFITLLTSVSINAQTQGQWLTYTDPEGGFTLEFPSFIKIVPKQNRFDINDLTFSNDNSSIRGYLEYGLSSNDTSPESLRKLVNAVNEALGNFLKEHRIIESNDTQINGNFAISQIVHDTDYEGNEYGIWEISSNVNNKAFKFAYISTPIEFDKGLPTVKKMLDSIKFLK